ncbi:MAG TPA: formimidoylglutamate deiminase, partial [Microbacterium sp.]|nr:formimidoylglutamate deiminase [Microbacterium sp.]
MTAARRVRAAAALVDDAFARDAVFTVRDGVVTAIETDAAPGPADDACDVLVPGAVDAHSHAFHRLLRGRTHADGGDFWQWRMRMYAEAAALSPESCEAVATQVYGELRDAGCTAVAEFHYVHHRPDGSPYPDHDMERALVRAAQATGIRLLLLDTCYLRGGVGQELQPEQRRFGDGSAQAWLERWHRLREALASEADRPDAPGVTLGAAIHSVRAVTPGDLTVVTAGLPGEVPLHVHVSEQRAENDATLQAYGRTPVELLADAGLLSPRLSAVHATHLTGTDIDLLGASGATIVMCPTTEADLGDGIGPAPELLAAGARLAIGSDQHAVADPWEETARLELDQRLRLERRGVFTPMQLWQAMAGGRPGSSGFRVGDPFDAVELDARSAR